MNERSCCAGAQACPLRANIARWVSFALAFPHSVFLLFAAGAGSLGVAYVAQHFFDVQPCILCIYQRIPYALIMFLSLIAIMCRRNLSLAQIMLWLCAIAMAVNAGTAFFHTGVELHWWAGTNECGVNPLVLKNVAQMREALLKTPLASCDQINFTFMGLTMANWNIPASLGLSLFALLSGLNLKNAAKELNAR